MRGHAKLSSSVVFSIVLGTGALRARNLSFVVLISANPEWKAVRPLFTGVAVIPNITEATASPSNALRYGEPDARFFMRTSFAATTLMSVVQRIDHPATSMDDRISEARDRLQRVPESHPEFERRLIRLIRLVDERDAITGTASHFSRLALRQRQA